MINGEIAGLGFKRGWTIERMSGEIGWDLIRVQWAAKDKGRGRIDDEHEDEHDAKVTITRKVRRLQLQGYYGATRIDDVFV